MKLSIHVDVNLRTPRWLRRVVMIGVPVVAMAVSGTVLSVPQFVANEALSAKKMNDNFKAVEAQVAALVPPGTVVAFAGPVTMQPPEGWLFCDGHEVSRTMYQALFDVIGTTAGDGNAASTFNLPDYRGRFLRGTDLGAGRDPDAATRGPMSGGGLQGDAVNSVQGDAFAAHDHGGSTGVVNNYNGGGVTNFLDYASGGSQAAFFYTQTASNAANSMKNHTHSIPSAGSSIETRPVNASVNYLIKY